MHLIWVAIWEICDSMWCGKIMEDLINCVTCTKIWVFHITKINCTEKFWLLSWFSLLVYFYKCDKNEQSIQNMETLTPQLTNYIRVNLQSLTDKKKQLNSLGFSLNSSNEIIVFIAAAVWLCCAVAFVMSLLFIIDRQCTIDKLLMPNNFFGCKA